MAGFLRHREEIICYVLSFKQVAKILLHNNTVWRTKSTEGPIFVVCYTNHALDQFLEEIHEFHKEGIVRVGGRSQSEVMKKCSLWTTKKRMLSKVLNDFLRVIFFSFSTPLVTCTSEAHKYVS